MSASVICKLNKFGHCKFGRYCHFKHENRKCQDSSCNAKACELRHPRKCFYILQNKPCKFGDVCSFEHDIHSDGVRDSETTLRARIFELEQIIIEKEEMVTEMKEEINVLQNSVLKNGCDIFEDEVDKDEIDYSIDSDSVESEMEASTSKAHSQSLFYQCDCCAFQTIHEIGLKIHKSKTHKDKCDDCEVSFLNKEQLERHKLAHVTLVNIEENSSEEFGLEIHQYQKDENCLGIYDLLKQRDDELPVLFLHSQECWTRSSHSCYDLPVDSDCHNDDGALVDHNTYDPTVHCVIGVLVDNDMKSMKSFKMDWLKIRKMIKDYAC